MRKLIASLFITLICLPALAQQQHSTALIKNEVVAECEATNPHDRGEGTIYTFVCVGADFKLTLRIPIADYPQEWAAPPLRKYHALGRASDNKLHFLKTEPTACDDDHPASRFMKPNINGCEARFKRN